MESKTNYTIVGMVVLILTVGLLSTMLWLSVGFNKKTYTHYSVYLHEPASGLNKDAPVKFNGVQVGYVYEIKLNKHDPRQVEIILNIETGTPITTSTAATLISQGITGVTYIGLSASSSDLTPLKKLPGEPYPIIPAKPSLFNQLDSLLKEVSESVNKVSVQAQRIFNEENAAYIRNILANTSKASNDFPAIVTELQTGISKFKTMADSLSKAGTSVSNTMGSGRSTLDKLSLETIAPTANLLRKLNVISANLEQVSNEMRQNPSIVVRGTATPKLGPGE